MRKDFLRKCTYSTITIKVIIPYLCLDRPQKLKTIIIWPHLNCLYSDGCVFYRQSVCSVCLRISVPAQLILKQGLWEAPSHLCHAPWDITVQKVNKFLGIFQQKEVNRFFLHLKEVMFRSGTKSGYEFPCPVGTYSDELGMSSVGQCIPCPGGQYCGSSGLSTPTGDCSPGWVTASSVHYPQFFTTILYQEA